MKNQLVFIFLSLLLLNSCQEPKIYNEYQRINNKWDIIISTDSTNALKMLDMSGCKMGKKSSKNEFIQCLGSINSAYVSGEGYFFSYQIMDDSKITISSVRYFPETISSGLTISQLKELEVQYNDYLKGTWIYTINENTMEWKKEESFSKVTFKLSNE